MYFNLFMWHVTPSKHQPPAPTRQNGGGKQKNGPADAKAMATALGFPSFGRAFVLLLGSKETERKPKDRKT